MLVVFFVQVYFYDFMDYYRDLSVAIENDECFRAVALDAWVLPPQDGRGNTSAGEGGGSDCRAVVTHPDGVQEVRQQKKRGFSRVL